MISSPPDNTCPNPIILCPFPARSRVDNSRMEIPKSMAKLFEPGEWALLTDNEEFVRAVEAVHNDETKDDVLKFALYVLALWRN
jgi:hypothetical protein